MGFQIASIDDPENTSPIVSPFCQVVEYHLNYMTRQVSVVVGVWRTLEAFQAKKKQATIAQVELSATKAAAWFKRLEAAMTLSQTIGELEQLCQEAMQKEKTND